MIESYYWRVELRSDLAWLQGHRKYRRWSEKQQVLFERKLMLVAFQVRSLLERPKVNDRARNQTISVVRFKKSVTGHSQPLAPDGLTNDSTWTGLSPTFSQLQRYAIN